MMITEFIRARLDDWAQAVEVAREYATGPMGGSDDKAAIAIIAENGRRLWSTGDLLAQVAAMRAIVELTDEATGLDMMVDSERRIGPRDTAAEPYVGEVMLRHLAAIWSDHDDYKPAWAPEGE